MSFNFGTPNTLAGAGTTTTLNFGLGSNQTANASTPAKPPVFGATFGSTAPTSTPGGFNLNTPAASAPPTLNFNAPASTSTGSTLSGFNLTATSASTNIPTLGLGASTTTTTTAQLGATTTSVPTSGFTLGSAPTNTGLSFGGLSSSGTTFGNTATSTTTNAGLSLGSTTATPLLLGSTATITPAIVTTTSTAPGSLNFNQIEEMLNKWTLELEEQGKVFINQALQLNAWDRLVIANGEKILTLNNGIEKVKQQQQQLDHELEFVLIQQRELEECITPLEKELKDIPIADHDRNHTYQMAENMDTQLKQMSEDLKEIIEHLNESNKKEDNDPVSQIGRILNAHMNSLQWIDRNTSQISTLLDQITKMHDMHRRDNERSFHLTYE